MAALKGLLLVLNLVPALASDRRTVAISRSGALFRLPDNEPGSTAKPPSASCRHLLNKSRHLIETDMNTRAEQSLPVPAVQRRAVRDLAAATKTSPQMLEALGYVSLGRALRTGTVWSVEDSNKVRQHCNGAEGSLEEHNVTDDGVRILEGDIVDASCDEELRGVDGVGYRGCQRVTLNGFQCQHWSSQKPQAHSWTPERYPQYELTSNFCRNPDGARGIWCYTTSPLKRWDYCVPLRPQPQPERRLWPGGAVAYCFHASASAAAKAALEAAMGELKQQVPCLSFRRVQLENSNVCAELPSVLVKGVPLGCWAHLGQVSGADPRYQTRSQLLNLGPGCELQGLAAHQLGHVLGLGHETSRADRDKYLRVNGSFPKDSEPATGTFDLLSLMMPPPRANDSLALEVRREPLLGQFLGQRLGFSQLDVERLGGLYGCPEQVAPQSPTRALSRRFLRGSGLVDDGSCADHNYTGVQYVDGSGVGKPYFCASLTSRCTEPALAERLLKNCALTCLACAPAPPGTVTKLRKARQKSRRRCMDAAVTGLRFSGGARAQCSELGHYCEHADLGSRVRAACARTCGRCELGTEAPSAVPRRPCIDHGERIPPLFTIAGRVAPCTRLTRFCRGHNASARVARKCAKTCGTCPGNRSLEVVPGLDIVWKSSNASAANGTVTTTVSATGSYTFSTAVPEILDKGMGCSRRRRWGFCQTRRRRLQ